METRHTPTPWQIWRDTDGVRYEVGPTINSFFTCAYVSGFYSNKAKANAEFIVKAVNAHDNLVTALGNIAGVGHVAAPFDRSAFAAALQRANDKLDQVMEWAEAALAEVKQK